MIVPLPCRSVSRRAKSVNEQRAGDFQGNSSEEEAHSRALSRHPAPPIPIPIATLILRLHHVQITVPADDEEAARQFYCGRLGLVESVKPASLAGRGGFWVELGEQQIHVSTEDGVNRMATKAHLAYEVADLVVWRERLVAAGCTILESIPIPGYDRFETRDPFGNRIELIERTEKGGSRRPACFHQDMPLGSITSASARLRPDWGCRAARRSSCRWRAL